MKRVCGGVATIRAVKWGCCLLVSLSPCLLVCPSRARAFDEVLDSPMYKDPDLPSDRVEWGFPEGAKALWLRALERSEAEMRCQAAEAIIRAHDRGVQGLDVTITPLLAALDRPDQH